MNDLPSGFEKRRFVRLPCAFDPRYATQAPLITVRTGQHTATGMLMDVGAGGVGLILPMEISRDAEVEVAFELRMKDATPFEVAARGVVRHCVPAAEPGTFRTGLEFTSIDESSRAKLVAYVESVL
jgi:c-di-GMP-binding flagellar brake protein YcgR